MDGINKELSHKSFLDHEYTIKHIPYENELNFYERVRAGDINGVYKTMNDLGGTGFGVLSEDRIRNIKYHLIITIAFITRFCVEGGMEMETAYNMSDIYILKTDKALSLNELSQIHKEMIFDFTNRMKHINRGDLYSKPIIMCFDFIYDNLHRKFSLSELAEYVSLSESYISRLFHSEVGITITTYLLQKRVEAASNMLKYSNYSSLDISNYLCFSSHSHFIQTFKKFTGQTPNKYREKYFRSNW